MLAVTPGISRNASCTLQMTMKLAKALSIISKAKEGTEGQGSGNHCAGGWHGCSAGAGTRQWADGRQDKDHSAVSRFLLPAPASPGKALLTTRDLAPH